MVCLLLAGASAAEWVKSLDLDRMLKEQDYLQRIVITYVADGQPTILRVYGSGQIVTQPVPSPRSTDVVATCTANVTPEEIKRVIQTMRDRGFFALEQGQYMTVGASLDDSKLHGVYISDSERITYRSFGTGKYGDEQLSIPEDFAAVEDQLQLLRDKALSVAAGRPCRLGRRIKWPE